MSATKKLWQLCILCLDGQPRYRQRGGVHAHCLHPYIRPLKTKVHSSSSSRVFPRCCYLFSVLTLVYGVPLSVFQRWIAQWGPGTHFRSIPLKRFRLSLAMPVHCYFGSTNNGFFCSVTYCQYYLSNFQGNWGYWYFYIYSERRTCNC